MTIEETFDQLEYLIDGLGRSLMSDGSFANAFSKILTDFRPLGALIRIAVDAKSPAYDAKAVVHPGSIKNLAIYEPREFVAPGGEVESRPNKDNAVIEFRIEAWWDNALTLPSSTRDKIFRQIAKAVELHWGTRDPLVLMNRLQGDGPKALNALRSAATDADCVGLVQLDLDDFKNLNKPDTGGYYDLGSAVIQEFASRGRAHFSDIGILLRTGNGDEFSIILAHDDPREILQRVLSFHEAIESTPFASILAEAKCTESAHKTASVGLVIYTDPSVLLKVASVEDALGAAANCQNEAKQAGKNRIRLPAPSDWNQAPSSIDELTVLRAALNARVDLASTDTSTFKSVTSNALAAILAEKAAAVDLEDFAEIPHALADRLGLILCGPQEMPVGNEVSPVVEISDWAAIVCRAVLQATYSNDLALVPTDELVIGYDASRLLLTIRRDGHSRATIKIIGEADAPVEAEVVVGIPWFSSNVVAGSVVRRSAPSSLSATRTITPGFMSPTMLVPIGDAAIDLARRFQSMVAAIVELDDRPVTGGGLPDFWQSNLARIIRSTLSNPNIERVLVVGNISSASETVARLRLPKAEQAGALYKWPQRLGIDAESLKLFFEHNMSVDEVSGDAPQLLRTLLSESSHIKNVNVGELAVLDFNAESHRRHRLSFSQVEDHSRLLNFDGLRARTIADAYPRAIQSLRDYNESFQIEPSGRKFREFKFFKVQLSQATQEVIPDYWVEEEESLKRYYVANFVDEEKGVFAKRLHLKIGDVSVTDAAAKEIATAIRQKRPTRRILLPLARVAENLEDVTQPLGLSAIQVLPRFRDGRWHLDFGWIWRTVEALSGFPFSAYGSVMWSQDFLERVRTRLKTDGFLHAIEFGELTYMALSFHMFSDIGDLDIARLIVVNAAD